MFYAQWELSFTYFFSFIVWRHTFEKLSRCTQAITFFKGVLGLNLGYGHEFPCGLAGF
jgi:hypothetical protein